jgi:hypothetical protein
VTTAETYVPLSRGIREHLCKLSGNAVKVYIYLLTTASFAGPKRGQVVTSFEDLASDLGMHRSTVYKATRKLRPYYVEWAPAKNQHDVTIFTIQKYKSVEDFAYSRTATSRETAGKRQVDGTRRNGMSQKDLAHPNKPYKPNKAKSACNWPWEVIGIPPTFNSEFNLFWESCYANRNGYTLSRAMRDCANAWESEGGTVPGPFFAVKAEIVKHERAVNELACNGEASKIPTPADCRPREH